MNYFIAGLRIYILLIFQLKKNCINHEEWEEKQGRPELQKRASLVSSQHGSRDRVKGSRAGTK